MNREGLNRLHKCTGWSSELQHEKRCFRGNCKQSRSRSASRDIQSDQELCYTLLCSSIPNDFISGQERPRSDCTDAQSDMGLPCLYTPKNIFWHGMAHLLQIRFFFFYSFFFQPKSTDMFLISPRKHMLWCSLEVPQWGASNEYPQNMF